SGSSPRGVCWGKPAATASAGRWRASKLTSAGSSTVAASSSPRSSHRRRDWARCSTPRAAANGKRNPAPARGATRRGSPPRGRTGRLNVAPDGHVGRFGRKAQTATLREFNATAFVMEMGITNPESDVEQTVDGQPLPLGVDPTPDPELSQADLDATIAFVRFLAPPAPQGMTVAIAASRQRFIQIGCAGCHVPYLKTGPNPVKALSDQPVPAFTDLLLHDMGPALADICLQQALSSEFRTEPLMGLRLKTAFLHDGLATSIEQ